MKIFSFFYKNGSVIISDDIYKPIMAGSALYAGNKIITGDDTGDNISAKNKYYSELTGIYWVWKNTNEDIVGSCHYRRFLTAKPYPFLYGLKQLFFATIGFQRKKLGLIYTNRVKLFRKRIITETEVHEILKDYDAILPKSRQFRYSIEEHYHRYHNNKDLPIVRTIISELFPNYLNSFDSTLSQNKLYANNMFIMKQADFDLFMNWWFSILFEFERRSELTQYSGYQQRVMGFIGERLLTVWFMHQKLKIKELPVIYFKKLKNE